MAWYCIDKMKNGININEEGREMATIGEKIKEKVSTYRELALKGTETLEDGTIINWGDMYLTQLKSDLFIAEEALAEIRNLS